MIKKTKAYQQMDPVPQRIANMAENKKKILHNATLLKNLGYEKWMSQNPNIPANWVAIVKELAETNPAPVTAVECPAPKQLHHIMLDLETLGTRSNAVIAVIAAVYFDPETGETGKEFYKRINIDSCEDIGLMIEAETAEWWLNQDAEAGKEIFSQENRISILQALVAFAGFLNIEEDVFIWGNSARFDCGLLENAYHALSLEIPWHHWNERDVRTLVSFAPEVKKNTIREGTHHNALDDCYHQIKYCSKIVRHLTSNI